MAAWVVAGALVGIGLRRFVSPRRGIFFGYLSLFVAMLAGCSGTDPNGSTRAASPVAIDETQA
ncbi:MAG: hypothetical protein OEY14_15290, partial [Myxococcales bacterium]|nr:hypothetical protein [Myxococcales bacterium]